MTAEQTRELHLERATLINQLIRARGLLAYLKGYMDNCEAANEPMYLKGESLAAHRKEVDAFLSAGLFGDKK